MRRSARQPELLRLLELLSPTDRRVLAQLWDAPSPEALTLLNIMTDADRVNRQWTRLSDHERAAMTRLLQDDGARPVAVFQREFGEVREPSHFEHPRAYLQALHGPATPTERLYSMGFFFRAYDERGPIYKIPNDLRPLLPQVPPRDRSLHVAPASDLINMQLPQLWAEQVVLALLTLSYRGELKTLEDGALNKASLNTLGRVLDYADRKSMRREADWPLVAFCRASIVEAGLLRRADSGELRPTPPALDWLQAPRSQRSQQLLDGWCASAIDDLTLLCGLRWKGGAPYTLNRSATRRNLLGVLGALPSNEWLPLHEICAEIQRVEPDFQRRDGRYDSWLLYDQQDRLVSGWQQWDRVEGQLIREVLRGPLRWLGAIELSSDGLFVRITPLGAHLLHPEGSRAPAPLDPPPAPLIVQSTFEVLCPPDASLYARFQLARVADLVQPGTVAVYKLSRAALLSAAERGIEAADVLRFLEQHAASPLPPAVIYTLGEWGGQTEQLRLESAVLLHAADPIVMARVRALKLAPLDDHEPLTPTLLALTPGAADDVAARLRQAGFGVRDERIDPQMPLGDRDLRALVSTALTHARLCALLDLPCEITPAMLQRLRQLVPPRHVAAAEQSAAEFVQQVMARLRDS